MTCRLTINRLIKSDETRKLLNIGNIFWLCRYFHNLTKLYLIELAFWYMGWVDGLQLEGPGFYFHLSQKLLTKFYIHNLINSSEQKPTSMSWLMHPWPDWPSIDYTKVLMIGHQTNFQTKQQNLLALVNACSFNFNFVNKMSVTNVPFKLENQSNP